MSIILIPFVECNKEPAALIMIDAIVSYLRRVWVGDRKLGAIGVQISRGVTSHGLAFNIAPNLERFNYIVPCGLKVGISKRLESIAKRSHLQYACLGFCKGSASHFARFRIGEEAATAYKCGDCEAAACITSTKVT